MLLKTISISIICSIFFTYFVKPLLDSRKFTLDIKVIKQLKSDKVYRRIALGFHESSSTICLSIILGVITGIILSIILLGFLEGFKLDFTTVVNDNNLDLTVGLLILGFIIFGISFMLSELNNIQYINFSIAYFNQLLKLISPYINDDAIKMHESEFARIKCKNDYIESIEKLHAVCKTEKIDVSKFSYKF